MNCIYARVKKQLNEQELLNKCLTMEGWTFAKLASYLRLTIPENPLQRKGWAGQAIEIYLGSTAGNRSLPDFVHLGIELKTLPLNSLGRPSESTFVTRIPMLTIHTQIFETSECFQKLSKILWVPIEGDTIIPYAHWRIGKAILWSPTTEDISILKEDWTNFVNLISLGQWTSINARIGKYLQIRPKAANSRSLCQAYDEEGNLVWTMPRGFYLRSLFTCKVLLKTSDS